MAEGAIKSTPTIAINNIPQNADGVEEKYFLKEFNR